MGQGAAALLIPALLLLVLAVRAFMPARTPRLRGENSISELRKVKLNGAEIQLMIRGCDRRQPVLLFVHGGPCCPEIPYVRKYQKALEKEFTVVCYDQRGSGKSFGFGKDYSGVTAATHTADLTALTEYVEGYLGAEQVILVGHSYGTYIASQAAALRPELYRAYIGIGQMADTAAGELNTLEKCIARAAAEGDEKTAARLEADREAVAGGRRFSDRSIVRRYGFAARGIDENRDLLLAFAFGCEYNLLDAARYYTAARRYQDGLAMEALRNPLSSIVTELELPVYFLMGKYDGMTSPEAAEEYLSKLGGSGERRFVLFENSAHYPQFEEREKFDKWMIESFR